MAEGRTQSLVRLENLLKASTRRQKLFRHVKKTRAWKRVIPVASPARDRAAEGISLKRALWTLPLRDHPEVRSLVTGREM